jgi:hypothetical protein
MKKSEIKKLKVGDTIRVNAIHYREGRKKCTRKIVEINSLGVGVRLFGWNPFFLRDSEIIEKV